MTRAAPIRRRLAPEKRRELIEAAACELFAEYGYAATTMNQIAAAAGVTKPILYRHFASKKALHLALLERHRDALAAGPIDEYLSHDGPLNEVLGPMLDAWFAYVEQNPYVWRLLFRDTTGVPDVAAFHEELRRRQRAADMAILRENLAGYSDEELEPLAEVVRCTLTGLALWWLDNPEVPRERVSGTALMSLSALLMAATAAAGRTSA